MIHVSLDNPNTKFTTVGELNENWSQLDEISTLSFSGNISDKEILGKFTKQSAL